MIDIIAQSNHLIHRQSETLGFGNLRGGNLLDAIMNGFPTGMVVGKLRGIIKATKVASPFGHNPEPFASVITTS